jgi:hypothetical protein
MPIAAERPYQIRHALYLTRSAFKALTEPAAKQNKIKH